MPDGKLQTVTRTPEVQCLEVLCCLERSTRKPAAAEEQIKKQQATEGSRGVRGGWEWESGTSSRKKWLLTLYRVSTKRGACQVPHSFHQKEHNGRAQGSPPEEGDVGGGKEGDLLPF